MLFGTFALSFIVTRNIIFPMYIILSIPRYAWFPDGTMMPDPVTNITIHAALWVLEILHVSWAFLICQMAYKALVEKGVGDDIRNVDAGSTKEE